MERPKRILLCNDDGFDAPGLCALEKAMIELGEVWKIAPDQQRSGCSHALNFHGPVTLIQLSERSFKLKNAYPADCANVGLHAKGFPKFDLVVSGINHGPNLGDDVHYSGTVAVARQGAIHHVRAVALSAVDPEASPRQMERIALWLKAWLEDHYISLRTRITYNINYPEEEKDIALEESYPEVSFSFQGCRSYRDSYSELERKDSARVLQLESLASEHVRKEESDFEAVLRKRISITPLSTYTTDTQELHRWKKEHLKAKIT